MQARHIFATLLLLVCVAFSASAQKAKLQRANNEYDRFNYNTAVQLYLEVLDKVDVAEAKIKLAESYRRMNNWKEAEYWYGQIVHLPDAKPVFSLYYGKALQANGKCDLAKEWFEEYARQEPDDLRGKLLSQACTKDEIERMINKCNSCYEIQPVPINTKYDDFGPQYVDNGLVFASERTEGGPIERTYEWTGFPFLELYFTAVDTLDQANFEYTYQKKPKEYRGKVNTKYHDGPVSFNKDQSKIFLTRNNYFERRRGRDDEGITRLKIFVGDRKGRKWENLQGLPFNSDEYSVAHPSLAPDGQTLFFSSDMPGGFGGMDLYYSTFEDGQWGPPINLGPRINTEGHEVFPAYHHASNKLYFASDGQVGLGGLDIYYVIDQDGVWTPPSNVGAPINSQHDDHSIILNDEETFGYFTSNRPGGQGRDDIYSFRKKVVKVELLVFDQITGDPIAGSDVFLSCSKETLYTGNDGTVEIEMPVDNCCNYTANKAGYMEKTQESCTSGYDPGTKMFVKIPLSPPMAFNLAGTITDELTGKPIAEAKVELTNDCGEEIAEFYTGSDGQYFFKDLKAECCYFVKAGKSPLYIAKTGENLCLKGMTKSQDFIRDIPLLPVGEIPIASGGGTKIDVNGDGEPDGIDKDNDGVIDEYFADIDEVDPDVVDPGTIRPKAYVIKHIYYDFDKAYIRDDAQGPLDTLIMMLRDNPEYIVEIGSHTDARGSNRYNNRLSQRRAKAVVKYLSKYGIDANRLRYEGYGEKQPTNECVDEVPCSEDQHQRNRRTEFRIVGTVNGGMFDSPIYSQAPVYVRTDPCVGCPF
jgi:outer membrane protein OmpA-like peptidoglycan-associated protein/tetratricopeptide (TPR) repeat protein